MRGPQLVIDDGRMRVRLPFRSWRSWRRTIRAAEDAKEGTFPRCPYTVRVGPFTWTVISREEPE